jgi:hypothetical protein
MAQCSKQCFATVIPFIADLRYCAPHIPLYLREFVSQLQRAGIRFRWAPVLAGPLSRCLRVGLHLWQLGGSISGKKYVFGPESAQIGATCSEA